MRTLFSKADHKMTRPIIIGVTLFILFALIGMKYDRSLTVASQSNRVDIEILPREISKFIDARARALVPVAILSSLDFDATTVNAASVSLAGAPITKRADGQFRGYYADVNGDAKIDLVIYVSAYSLALPEGSSDAVLTAMTFDGKSVTGSQKVTFNGPVISEPATFSEPFAPAGTFSNPALINITDSFTPPTTASPYPSNIVVSGETNISKVTVRITNYRHTFPDDVDILLSPAAFTYQLLQIPPMAKSRCR